MAHGWLTSFLKAGSQQSSLGGSSTSLAGRVSQQGGLETKRGSWFMSICVRVVLSGSCSGRQTSRH